MILGPPCGIGFIHSFSISQLNQIFFCKYQVNVHLSDEYIGAGQGWIVKAFDDDAPSV